jgi:hypothetical protein
VSLVRFFVRRSVAFTACSNDEETVLGTGTALEFDNLLKETI